MAQKSDNTSMMVPRDSVGSVGRLKNSVTQHHKPHRYANECLESLSLTVFTQINFVTVFSSEVRFYTENGILSPLWWLRGNVRCSS